MRSSRWMAAQPGRRNHLTSRSDIWRKSARLQVGTTGIVSPVDLSLMSEGGERTGGAAVFVNGGNLAFNGRGIGMVAVLADGSLAGRAAFDTSRSPEESDRLVSFVSGLPTGAIVAVAVNGHVTRYLKSAARAALGDLGASVWLPEDLTLSYVLIGVKGGTVGCCPERAGQGP